MFPPSVHCTFLVLDSESFFLSEYCYSPATCLPRLLLIVGLDGVVHRGSFSFDFAVVDLSSLLESAQHVDLDLRCEVVALEQLGDDLLRPVVVQPCSSENAAPLAAIALLELFAVVFVEVNFCPGRGLLPSQFLRKALLLRHIASRRLGLFHVFADLLDVLWSRTVNYFSILEDGCSPHLLVGDVQARSGWTVAHHRVPEHGDPAFDVCNELFQLFALAFGQVPHSFEILDATSSRH